MTKSKQETSQDVDRQSFLLWRKRLVKKITVLEWFRVNLSLCVICSFKAPSLQQPFPVEISQYPVEVYLYSVTKTSLWIMRRYSILKTLFVHACCSMTTLAIAACTTLVRSRQSMQLTRKIPSCLQITPAWSTLSTEKEQKQGNVPASTNSRKSYIQNTI